MARAEYDARAGSATAPQHCEWGFGADRARANQLVRQAALGRVRDALERVFGPCEEPPASGFDVACTPQRREMWRRRLPPRVLGRLVAEVDAAAVEECWARAMRVKRDDPREMCVLLMGSTVSPALDLGKTIEELRRRPTRARANLTVVLVDIAAWSARVPDDAPAAVRSVLQRLQST
jgi:hypothetical protein